MPDTASFTDRPDVVTALAVAPNESGVQPARVDRDGNTAPILPHARPPPAHQLAR